MGADPHRRLHLVRSSALEEKDMVERFPVAYPAYRTRTKRLIPFVY